MWWVPLIAAASSMLSKSADKAKNGQRVQLEAARANAARYGVNPDYSFLNQKDGPNALGAIGPILQSLYGGGSDGDASKDNTPSWATKSTSAIGGGGGSDEYDPFGDPWKRR